MNVRVRILNRESALHLSEKAWKDGRGQHGDRLVLALLPEGKVFPIGNVTELPNGDYRCLVCINEAGDTFFLDLTAEEVEALPLKDLS